MILFNNKQKLISQKLELLELDQLHRKKKKFIPFYNQLLRCQKVQNKEIKRIRRKKTLKIHLYHKVYQKKILLN